MPHAADFSPVRPFDVCDPGTESPGWGPDEVFAGVAAALSAGGAVLGSVWGGAAVGADWAACFGLFGIFAAGVGASLGAELGDRWRFQPARA
jgi:hypothetical protein